MVTRSVRMNKRTNAAAGPPKTGSSPTIRLRRNYNEKRTEKMLSVEDPFQVIECQGSTEKITLHSLKLE